MLINDLTRRDPNGHYKKHMLSMRTRSELNTRSVSRLNMPVFSPLIVKPILLFEQNNWNTLAMVQMSLTMNTK